MQLEMRLCEALPHFRVQNLPRPLLLDTQRKPVEKPLPCTPYICRVSAQETGRVSAELVLALKVSSLAPERCETCGEQQRAMNDRCKRRPRLEPCERLLTGMISPWWRRFKPPLRQRMAGRNILQFTPVGTSRHTKESSSCETRTRETPIPKSNHIIDW